MGSHHDSFNGTHHYDSPRIASEGKIIMEGIVSLFTAVLFFLGMHIYVRCFWGHRGSLPRRRLSFASEQDPLRLRNVGLCKSAIEALPVFVYQLENHKDGLECAVCLCEFKADEKGRLLPKCHHSFHIECIDMWFQSHSTCPLCRASAQPDTPADSVVVVVEEAASGSAFETEQQVPPVSEGNASISREPEPDIGLCHSCRQDEVLQSPTYSTNMLFWANEKRVSSVSNSAFFDQGTTSTPRQALDKIAIGIPRRVDSFSSPRLFCSDNQQLFSPSDRSNPPAFVSVL